MSLEWIGKYECGCTDRVRRREFLRLRCPVHKKKLIEAKPIHDADISRAISIDRQRGFQIAEWAGTVPERTVTDPELKTQEIP